MKRQVLTIPLLILLFGLSSCAYGIKALPEDLKEGLSASPSFKEIILDPKAAIGKKVLLGGVILETRVSQERTTLVVLQKPLNGNDRPLQNDQSAGRFLVEWGGRFLDPAIYKAGRELTVIGEITEERSEKIGEMTYRYPAISADYLYLWQDRFYPPRDFYGPGPYWPRYPYYREPFPYRYPYWGWPFRYPITFYPSSSGHR